MELSKRISKARIKAGLTLWELSEAVQVDTATVSAWEAGTITPDAKEIVLLSKALHVSVESLLNDVPETSVIRQPLSFGQTIVACMLGFILAIMVLHLVSCVGCYW